VIRRSAGGESVEVSIDSMDRSADAFQIRVGTGNRPIQFNKGPIVAYDWLNSSDSGIVYARNLPAPGWEERHPGETAVIPLTTLQRAIWRGREALMRRTWRIPALTFVDSAPYRVDLAAVRSVSPIVQSWVVTRPGPDGDRQTAPVLLPSSTQTWLWSPDGRTVAGLTLAERVAVYDTSRGIRIIPVDGSGSTGEPLSRVTSPVAWSTSGYRLAWAVETTAGVGARPSPRICILGRGQAPPPVIVPLPSKCIDLALDDDARRLLYLDDEGTLWYGVRTLPAVDASWRRVGSLLHQLQWAHSGTGAETLSFWNFRGLSGLSIDPKWSRVAVGLANSGIYVLNLAEGNR
jgi:hypothetical protein